MLDMRHSEQALAKQTSENLATSIDSDIGRTIEQYDLSLRAVVSGINTPEIRQLSRELRQLILFDKAPMDDPRLVFHRTVLVAFPAAFAATAVDFMK